MKPKDKMYPNFEMSTQLCLKWYTLARLCYDHANDNDYPSRRVGWFEGLMDVFNAFVALGEGSNEELTNLVELLERELEDC